MGVSTNVRVSVLKMMILANMWIHVVLITYASLIRPVFENVDVYHMWIWQAFTLLFFVIPLWNEITLFSCFLIASMDAHTLTQIVKTMVFPKLQRTFAMCAPPHSE